MASATPFDILGGGLSQVDDEIAPEFRTPAFRAPGADLEETKLDMEEHEILQLLGSYFDEAENARETGLNPRHEVWEQNLHGFWMRKDFGDKMDWQSREVSSAIPNFVERFAANHRQALTQSRDWARVQDLDDPHGKLTSFATKLTRLALDFSGTNSSGQPIPFEYLFGNIVLTGALMSMTCAVTWDPRTGRVVTEQVDPRQCYWDPTGRGLYRVRFWDVDKETLLRMADLEDDAGEALFDREAIQELVASESSEIIENKEVSSGQGHSSHSARTPIILKEWLVDLIDRDGGDIGSHKVRERQLIVTANDGRIIRGPEPNPWWHGKDWIVNHPVLQAPLAAVDGRTYVELFRHQVATHENVTNRIIDNLSMNMNAFEVNPDLLDNPESIEFGIAPNQTILRADDAPPNERAVQSIDMGKGVTPDMINIWQGLRQEMQEAAAQSDLSLGQPVASGQTTATEVAEASKGQSALNNSISMDMDLGFLTPISELVYYTALQHVTEAAPAIWNGLTPDEQAMLTARRDEFRSRAVVVKAQGLTTAVEKGKRIRGLMGALNVIGGNPLLIQAFQQSYSIDRLVALVLEDFGVPMDRIELNEQEKLRQIEAKAKQDFANSLGGGPGGPGGPTAQNQGGTDPLAPGVAEGLPGGIV